MGRKKKHTSQLNVKVALEAVKAVKTISQTASEYGLHPQQVRAWKREFLKNIHLEFKKEDQDRKLKSELDKAYKKVGKLENF